MFSKYYQDELRYLHDLGKEYAARYPLNAAFLGTDATDPDVERLLQGFAFLTARLHERLDNQYSEVAEGFMSLLWPQYLRPTPALSTVQFRPDKNQLHTAIRIPAGAGLTWGNCRFRTSRSVQVLPFQIDRPELESRADHTLLRLPITVHGGSDLRDAPLGALPVYLSGEDPRITYGWYTWLTQHVQDAWIASDAGDRLGTLRVERHGFENRERLMPEPPESPPGYSYLREFFAYPESFLSVALVDLAVLGRMETPEHFDIMFDFGRRRPPAFMEPDVETFRLYCSPVVNLFESQARVRLDHTRSEYRVRSDEYEIEDHEVYSVDHVSGTITGSGRQVEYLPFYDVRVQRPRGDDDHGSYRVRFDDIHVMRKNRPLTGRECFVSLHHPLQFQVPRELQTVSFDITCTSREQVRSLKPGDPITRTGAIPASVEPVSIGRITSPVTSPASPEYHWRLLSHFHQAHLSLVDPQHLRAILELYTPEPAHGSGRVDPWLPGFEDIEATPDVIVENGVPLRCYSVRLKFQGENDRSSQFYVFGGIVAEFLRQCASLNTRLKFNIEYLPTQESYAWPTGTGHQPIL